MLDMNATQPALPLMDVSGLCTRRAAAQRLGVDYMTVVRWIRAGKLTELRPTGAKGERPPVLLAKAQVEEFRKARALVRG